MTKYLAIALTLAAAPLIDAAPASADLGVRISGSAHIRFGGGIRLPRWRHGYVRPRPIVPIWIGYRFSQPPPAYEPCTYCAPPPAVPAYYPPVYAQPAAPAQPPLPRFGLGAFFGGVNVEGEHAGDDVGLLARLRITPGLILEGEVAKTELVDGDRVDRRFSAGLLWEINPYRRWAPYLLAAAGAVQIETGDAYQTDHSFAEVGIGLRYAVGPRFHLTGDVRGGSRQPVEQEMTAARVLPPEGQPDPSESEEYTRARIAAVVYF